jgi:glycosyltransferase involved in cell wall biosynthesis
VGLDATICIGTFGGNDWVRLAHERAIPSAEAQGVPVIHRHAPTLARARNEALALARTPWVIYLDADDELAPGYVKALDAGGADLRAPSVSYVKLGRPRTPYMPKVAGHDHACSAKCLRDGNWLLIGTAIHTDHAREVGGFREFDVYEDWDLFQRIWLAGATVEAIPEAVYLAHWRRHSRNRAPDIAVKNRVHREIIDANFGKQLAA